MTTTSETRRLLIVETMLGWTGEHSRSQGEQLTELLRSDGHRVHAASRRVGRAARLADMTWSVVRHRRSDVVSIAVFSGPGFTLADVTARLAQRLHLPIVLVLHGGALADYAAAHPERVRRLFARAAVVVAPSRFNAEALAAYHRDEIEVLPNVVDVAIDEWRPRSKLRPRVLWMRSLHEIYGPDVALQAFASVHATHQDARLTMAGPDKGEIVGQMRELAQRLGIAEAVEFTGFLDPAAKAQAFLDHDIFLNTSRVDNTPVSLLEAAAHGLPVVSTDPGGIPSLFDDGQNALLASVDDSDALTAHIQLLLSQPDAAGALSEKGRDLVASMTWPSLRERWADVFDRAGGRSTLASKPARPQPSQQERSGG